MIHLLTNLIVATALLGSLAAVIVAVLGLIRKVGKEAEVPAVASKPFCRYCGRKFEDHSVECKHCGAGRHV